MIYNYIEYGVRNLNKKKILRYVTKQTAYDLWHLGVRFREKSKLIKLFNSQKKIKLSDIPRVEKFYFLYLTFLVSKISKILEIGSSSCEFIEGIELFNKIFRKDKHNKAIKYYGIDTNEDFNILSNYIAKSKKNYLSTFPTLKKFLNKNKDLKRFFLHDLGVMHYEFKSTKSFINYLNRFNSAFIRVCFSKKKGFISQKSGQKFYYFSLNETLKLSNKPIYFLYSGKKWSIANKKKDFLDGYFYIGNNVDKIIKLMNKHKKQSGLGKILKKIDINISLLKKN